MSSFVSASTIVSLGISSSCRREEESHGWTFWTLSRFIRFFFSFKHKISSILQTKLKRPLFTQSGMKNSSIEVEFCWYEKKKWKIVDIAWHRHRNINYTYMYIVVFIDLRKIQKVKLIWKPTDFKRAVYSCSCFWWNLSDHSNESYWAVLPCGTVIMLYKVCSNFYVCGSNPCDHSNESYWAVISCGTVYYVAQDAPNFEVCEWELSSNTFMWYCLWLLSVLSKKVLTLRSVDETLVCDHSRKAPTCSSTLCGT